jgi:hypothetical protein
MSARAVCFFLLAAAPLLAAPAKPEAADPRESLETAIPHGIKLLEGKKYAEFLKTYAPPTFIKKVGDTGLKKAAEEFGMVKAKALLLALKDIKGTTPTLSADGKQATFKLKSEVLGNDHVIWYKDGKTWYISD